MRIVQTVASTRAEHGGPSRSVPALCEALAAEGFQVELVTREVEEGNTAILPADPVRARVVRPRSGPLRAIEVADFARALKAVIPGADVVHDHGAWLHTNWTVSRLSNREGVPLVVSPRGMLTDWAWQFKRWKKRLAWVLYQRRVLERVEVVHVTAEAEARDLWRRGVEKPVAIVPNGVVLPKVEALDRRGGCPRRALFLSRLHPKKGIPTLVEAWGRVRPADWTLTIAGPGDGGHRREIAEMIGRSHLEDAIQLRGEISDDEKWDLYAEADLFVLPTWSENFGVVVAEALGVGVPVITTRAAPWEEIERERCGWWIDTGVEPLRRALEEATSVSDEQRREMGRRGRDLVRRAYSWERAAARMRSVYEWVAGAGPRPDCVWRPRG